MLGHAADAGARSSGSPNRGHRPAISSRRGPRDPASRPGGCADSSPPPASPTHPGRRDRVLDQPLRLDLRQRSRLRCGDHGRPQHPRDRDRLPDRFWGPRGGGGNFGIVTGFTYRLAQVGPEIVGGAIAWRVEEAPRILEAFRALAEESPLELGPPAGLEEGATSVPWLSQEIHGQDIVALFFCYTGPVAEGERLVAPIKDWGGPSVTWFSAGRSSRRESPRRHTCRKAGGNTGNRSTSGTRRRAAGARAGARGAHCIALLTRHLLPPARSDRPSPTGLFAGRQPGSLLHVQHRRPRGNAPPMTRPTSGGPDPRGGPAPVLDRRDVRELPYRGRGSERIHAAYGRNYERLAAVKAQWDPNNLFYHNKNIPPTRE